MHVYDLLKKNDKNLRFGEESLEYIPRFQFSKKSNLLSVQSLNRLQNHLKLWHVDSLFDNTRKSSSSNSFPHKLAVVYFILGDFIGNMGARRLEDQF